MASLFNVKLLEGGSLTDERTALRFSSYSKLVIKTCSPRSPSLPFGLSVIKLGRRILAGAASHRSFPNIASGASVRVRLLGFVRVSEPNFFMLGRRKYSDSKREMEAQIERNREAKT